MVFMVMNTLGGLLAKVFFHGFEFLTADFPPGIAFLQNRHCFGIKIDLMVILKDLVFIGSPWF